MDAGRRFRGTTDAGREYRRARGARRAVAVAVAIALVVISAPAGARPTARAATVRPNILSAVDGTSPSNAWAVGTTTVGSASRALIEHWNGTSWQIQKSANVGTGDSFLTGVEAISPTNAWAVGTVTVSGNPEGLIEHWNGSSWTVQKSAQVSGAVLSLNGVAATSATNAWAVGVDTATGTDLGQTFIERWNGTAWTRQTSPDATTNTNFLTGVTAASSSHAWVVGAAFENASSLQNPLVEQWNGTGWSVQPSQSPGAEPQDTLAAVSATATGAAWAVGSFLDSKNVSRSVIERLGAGGWTLQTSPNRGSSNNFLTAVAATSVTNAWAAGQSNSGGIKTLIERWSGSAWTIQATPNQGTRFSILQGIDATSAKNAWAVGDFGGFAGDQRTLIEHWNGSAWKIQMSPNA